MRASEWQRAVYKGVGTGPGAGRRRWAVTVSVAAVTMLAPALAAAGPLAAASADAGQAPAANAGERGGTGATGHLPPPAGSDVAPPPGVAGTKGATDTNSPAGTNSGAGSNGVAGTKSAAGPQKAAGTAEAAAPRADAPLPVLGPRNQAELSAALQGVLALPALRGSKVGVVVRRLDDGDTLFARGGQTQLVPASNVKLVTTAAALDSLSPDFRFQTEVYGQLIRGGVVDGPLYVKGYGDPYLVPERIGYLVSRLRLRGVGRIDGDLVVDDTFFAPEAAMALGWQEDRSSRAYMAPAGALSVGFNAVLVQVGPSLQAGEAPQVLLDPRQDFTRIDARVEACGRRGGLRVDVVPGGAGNVVRVAGELCGEEGVRTFWRRIDAPGSYAGAVIRQALAEADIEIRGKVRRAAVPVDAPLLFTLSSPRLAELLVPLNKYSNNFMAMQLALVLGAYHYGAPATWPKAKRALDQFMAHKVGIRTEAYTLHNASGLHGVNAMSAAQLVDVLHHVARQPTYRTEFVNSLAVAGGSGTLQDRMVDGPATARVRAKTGTLAQAAALSGYAETQSGVPLAFSLLVNGYRHIEDVWAAQDTFANVLASSALPPARPSAPARVATHLSSGEAHP